MVLTILVQSEIVESILGLKFNDEQYLGHCIQDYIWNSLNAFLFGKKSCFTIFLTNHDEPRLFVCSFIYLSKQSGWVIGQLVKIRKIEIQNLYDTDSSQIISLKCAD